MPKTTRHRWDPLVAVSLAAGVGFTAYAEYQLARAIGAAVPVAVLLPLAIDVYVVAAIRRSRGRDIALSLVLMGTAQIAAHMLEARVAVVSVPLVAAVSLLVPLVIWRVHTLAVPPATAVPASAREAVPVPGGDEPETTVSVTVEQQPVPAPEIAPVPPAGTADTPANCRYRIRRYCARNCRPYRSRSRSTRQRYRYGGHVAPPGPVPPERRPPPAASTSTSVPPANGSPTTRR